MFHTDTLQKCGISTQQFSTFKSMQTGCGVKFLFLVFNFTPDKEKNAFFYCSYMFSQHLCGSFSQQVRIDHEIGLCVFQLGLVLETQIAVTNRVQECCVTYSMRHLSHAFFCSLISCDKLTHCFILQTFLICDS